MAEAGLSSLRVLVNCIHAQQADLKETCWRMGDALQQVLVAQEQALSFQDVAKSSVEQLRDYVYPDDKMIY
ncbi:protein of unknown function [Caballeronia sp. S22]